MRLILPAATSCPLKGMAFRLSLAALLLAALPARAQLSSTDAVKTSLSAAYRDTVAWTRSGTASLGANQGFLHNWASGGELASLTVNALFSAAATRYYHRHLWTSNLDLFYALYYAYSQGFQPRKTEDRIDLTSKYGYLLDTGGSFYLAGLLNAKTQASPGYDYSLPEYDTFPTSRALSPAYFTAAIGGEYRKGTRLSLFLSPLAARLTLVDRQFTTRLPEGAYGVPFGERSRTELGAYFTSRYTTNPEKKTVYKTRLDLYTNYLAKDKLAPDGVIVVKKDNPGNIDLLWDHLLSTRLNKYLSITLAATLVYDNDQPYLPAPGAATGPTEPRPEPGSGLGWWQVKEVATVGLQYKF